MNEKDPDSVTELCDYVLKYADDIYVRAEVKGEVGTYALSELPVKTALENAFRWIKRGQVPPRVTRPEEAGPSA